MKVWSLLLILCLLMSCTAAPAKIGVKLYYPANTGESLLGYEIADILTPQDTVAMLMNPPTDSALHTMFATPVKCQTVIHEGSDVTVDFTKEYYDMLPIDRSVAEACMVLTLTQFQAVDRVRVSVEGVMVTDFLTGDDILLGDRMEAPVVVELQVFLFDTVLQELSDEYHSVVLREGQSAERCLFDEMLKSSGSHVSLLPPKTRLLSSERQDDTLILNLSTEFVTDMEQARAEKAVSGIVRSFTALEGVNKLSLQVEGAPLTRLGSLVLPDILTADWSG